MTGDWRGQRRRTLLKSSGTREDRSLTVAALIDRHPARAGGTRLKADR